MFSSQSWFSFGFFAFLLGIGCCQKDTSNHYFIYDRGSDTWVEMQPHGRGMNAIWKKECDVKVIVHGFNAKSNLTPFEVIAHQQLFILAKEYDTLYKKFNFDVNLIMVDWTNLATASALEYLKAAANSFPAGVQIAEFLVNLRSYEYINKWDQVHLIGHSLGAHASAVAGWSIQQVQNGAKVARITGLDPAGPGFTVPNKGWPADMTRVLDHSDARFVDIIHTNQGSYHDWYLVPPLLWGTFGSDLASGHVDFYPNGGKHMPQCNKKTDRIKFCSHQMSVLYFAFALRHYDQVAWTAGCPCSSHLKYILGLCACSFPETADVIGQFTNQISPEPRRQIYLTLTNKKINQDYFD